MIRLAFGLAVCAASLASAQESLPAADIYVLGETHDNAVHHQLQADLIAQISPTAVVMEQLTREQADRILPDTPRTASALDEILDWSTTGWPAIDIYLPIFTASDAPILGAAGEPGDLSAFALDTPLPDAQQAAREQLQADAHCGALPEDILPRFVDRQRALDAQFAARTLEALDRFGPPVVLITGNGHAREDWGVPAAIAVVRPDLTVISVLKGEDGTVPAGGNQIVLDAPSPEREDPCDAFR
ncbi:MAG: ChaN family lipoprotein [Pseudomonadota bacterium]